MLGAQADAASGAEAAKMLEALRQSITAPAIQASVRIDGEEVFGFASGYARLQPQTEVTRDHIFPIASISKSVTGIIAARLAAAGRLDLDRPIGNYIAGLPIDKQAITSRQLLSHQAGIRHYRFALNPPFFSDSVSHNRFENVTDSLRRFIDDPLLSEPGEQFTYSTYGYTLMSAVLEAAADMPFDRLLDHEIVQPASLSTLAYDPGPMSEGRVDSYIDNPLSDTRVLQLAEPSVSWKWAGGGLVASARDLTQFAQAVMDGTLLDAETREVAFDPIAGASDEGTPDRYALGWYNDTRERAAPDGTPYRAIHHGGTAFGAQSFLIMLPEAGISVAILVNAFVGGSEAVVPTAVDVLDLFLPLAESPP
jgi:CubicO group peptidase (beta-lactamase class C family)